MTPPPSLWPSTSTTAVRPWRGSYPRPFPPSNWCRRDRPGLRAAHGLPLLHQAGQGQLLHPRPQGGRCGGLACARVAPLAGAAAVPAAQRPLRARLPPTAGPHAHRPPLPRRGSAARAADQRGWLCPSRPTAYPGRGGRGHVSRHEGLSAFRPARTPARGRDTARRDTRRRGRPRARPVTGSVQRGTHLGRGIGPFGDHRGQPAHGLPVRRSLSRRVRGRFALACLCPGLRRGPGRAAAPCTQRRCRGELCLPPFRRRRPRSGCGGAHARTHRCRPARHPGPALLPAALVALAGVSVAGQPPIRRGQPDRCRP